MKKIIAMLLVVAMVLSLAACGGKDQSSETEEPENSSAVTENTPEPTPEIAESKPTNGAATIVTSDTLEEAGTASGEIRGGTNQDDAVLLPMNTKLYGTVQNGAISWFAFTTGDREGTAYPIITVNKTIGSSDLVTIIYDEEGTQLESGYADSEGIASTISTDQLAPNTIYYLAVRARNNAKDVIDYRLMIKDPDKQSGAYSTVGTLTEARGVSGALEGEIYPGSNQDDAAIIPVGVKISGTVQDGICSWFAFTTDESENGTYKITTVNKTVDSSDLVTIIYDEYGTQLENGYADNDGSASTINTDQLSPNTVYYVEVRARNYAKDSIDYTLSIQAPEAAESGSAAVEKADEEPLVFETPFELNETQVLFVADKAVFVDENAAKAALKPVADVILAHPDHTILLAGTTATIGKQASCVTLSNKRAEAVKDLLVSAFGVPESQLLTVGLGYEADPFVRGKDRDANGNFVETEGAKNRRVVVMDANDPIAQEILQK